MTNLIAEIAKVKREILAGREALSDVLNTLKDHHIKTNVTGGNSVWTISFRASKEELEAIEKDLSKKRGVIMCW